MSRRGKTSVIMHAIGYYNNKIMSLFISTNVQRTSDLQCLSRPISYKLFLIGLTVGVALQRTS